MNRLATVCAAKLVQAATQKFLALTQRVFRGRFANAFAWRRLGALHSYVDLRQRITVVVNDDRQLARLALRVGKHLLVSSRGVATAESCTGGWIAKALTDVAGSSAWVLEGFVTYSNAAKMRTLGVSPRVLESNGAVSEPVARAMARGALECSGADLTVAVTGIAGPGGAVPGKPVGTVWFAWAARRGRRIHVSAAIKHFKGDRETVRRKTVRTALAGLLQR
jgi:nicotinamide-nucleotide amidase